MLILHCRHIDRPLHMFVSSLPVLVRFTALATLMMAQTAAAAASISKDAQTLLKEQAWAKAFQWNSSSSMCHDWLGVRCDETGTHVTDL